MTTPWIFGYGSLVWRPAFSYLERRKGRVTGWQRRFWQGSTDHRGVPTAPGRVVTMVASESAVCWGMLYRVAPQHLEVILTNLDQREQGGYQRLTLAVETDYGTVTALTYVAPEGNPNYLGPAPEDVMVAQIATAVGPSGSNREYLLRLHDELAAAGIRDDHLTQLSLRLRAVAG